MAGQAGSGRAPGAKHYLEVPYAQKDQAKALGARWDPARKKWYVPGGIDLAAFSAWMPAGAGTPDVDHSPAAKPAPGGVVTIAHTAPADPHFVPYDGEAPPWE
ncbi:DUF5710 domain-containing protein [Methyloterricola oryzae]|uniref:DUF5710 domain-containing protein n=1 Tax=Methyloterricola oryzae TaxID=1495050 RepID=UPI0005EB5379|nr:DUF5710 domain-containing protein [Methyloterricola oryzae]